MDYENSNNITSKVSGRIRPQQVLLVGLGGVGSRTVDRILSIMPEEYKRYTKAIAIDTDMEDIENRLKYIPEENRIALGSNPDNGQSLTVGEYIRENPQTMKWFVKGDHLDTIKKRNTTQGAKQIRMVSRIALAATNKYCGMSKKLQSILHEFNHDDGAVHNRGLLVMVICSIAGGTGAGTVLQFPMYLEDALSQNFPQNNVQIECSMLLPNLFSRVQDIENHDAAKANAYAVIRELMALNSHRLKRSDFVEDTDLHNNEVSPYGRVHFFDDMSMSGDSIEGDVDHVYVPKIAETLNEYLFGKVSGKIASALDNTLARVYASKDKAIFNSVGTAKLEFPRTTYVQYATAQLVSSAISEKWVYPDVKTKKIFDDMSKNARENDQPNPTDWDKRNLYCKVVEEENGQFFKDIKSSFYSVVDNKKMDIVTEFWRNCEEYLHEKIKNDAKINSTIRIFEEKLKAKGEQTSINESLQSLETEVAKILTVGLQYELDVVCPTEATTPGFYTRNKDNKYLFTFLKKKNLHPIMLRCFLYKLYEKADAAAKRDKKPIVDYAALKDTKRYSDRRDLSNTAQASIMTSAKSRIVANFAKHLCEDIQEYITEVEDMFKSLDNILVGFNARKKRSFELLEEINKESGVVLAGGPLSMMYAWSKVNQYRRESDDADVIDVELNNKIHEIIYKGFVQQVTGKDNSGKNGRPHIRVRTKYESIISRELQKYYAVLLNRNYSMCFPENVLQAALWECGLSNAFKNAKNLVDEPKIYTFEDFINNNAQFLNFGDNEKVPAGLESDAQCLNKLLSAMIGKAKPYCGRVEDNGNRPIINRQIIIDRALLRKEETRETDEFGVAETRYVENKLIDGVSTSSMGGHDVGPRFVDNYSKDEIKCVTSISGMQPFNFVAFLPPDDNEHAPNEGKTYYAAYKEHIDNVSIKKDQITPHLHRDWHLAGKLEDFTQEYTNTYNKDAAIAFMYGFIFDVIRIVDDGMVEIGKQNVEHFNRAFGDSFYQTFMFLDANVHASIDAAEIEKKRSTLNSVLVKVFEMLATSQPIRHAITAYAEERMSEFVVQSSPQFIQNCLEAENISNVSYSCILDVIDGYYQGTRQLPYNEKDRSDKNTSYMFNFLLEKTYETCKMFSSDVSDIKTLYEKFVKAYYAQAVCDEDEASVDIQTEDSDADNDFSDIMKMIKTVTGDKHNAHNKPFGVNGKYSQKNAQQMIEFYLNEN